MSRCSGMMSKSAIVLVILGLVACSSDDTSSPVAQKSEPAKTTEVSNTSAPASMQDGPEEQAADTAPDTNTPNPIATAETEPVAEIEKTPAPTEDSTDVAPKQYIVKGVVTQWDPMVLFVQPGDQIVFKQMTGHDSESLEGMIPEGGTHWKSKLGQEGFAITLEVPGVYLYKCNPHVSLGMIGAIVVGDPPPENLPAVEANPQNKGMIGRAIRKLKQALAAKSGG